MENSTIALSDGIRQALQALDYDWVHRRYWEQNECVLLEHVLVWSKNSCGLSLVVF
jgi:hypothetical protein